MSIVLRAGLALRHDPEKRVVSGQLSGISFDGCSRLPEFDSRTSVVDLEPMSEAKISGTDL
jgi:hypothetical protein